MEYDKSRVLNLTRLKHRFFGFLNNLLIVLRISIRADGISPNAAT